MVGLDASGKTTILYKLKLGEIVTTIPTIGERSFSSFGLAFDQFSCAEPLVAFDRYTVCIKSLEVAIAIYSFHDSMKADGVFQYLDFVVKKIWEFMCTQRLKHVNSTNKKQSFTWPWIR